MERRPHYKQDNASNVMLVLTLAVSTAAALGYFKSQDEDAKPVQPITDVAPLVETESSPTPTQSPVPTLNGIQLPIQIHPSPTPTNEVSDIFSTITARER